uniref:Uncharacterized protein n=1 Tax=Arundo donax TaxID=35708 RepID=A0A0A9C9E9_ARUDO
MEVLTLQCGCSFAFRKFWVFV